MKSATTGSKSRLQGTAIGLIVALLGPGAVARAEPPPNDASPGWHYDASLPFGLTRGLWQDDFEIQGRSLGIAMALPLDVLQFPFRVSPAGYDAGYFFGLSRSVLATSEPEAQPALQALIITGPLDLALLPLAALAGLAGPDALATSRGVPLQDYTPLVRGLGTLAAVPLDTASLPLTLLGGLRGD